MLCSPDNFKQIRDIPHPEFYNRCRERLSPQEYDSIYEELYRRVSKSPVQTSSWLPGSDWTGTVYGPIYEKACLRDRIAAARFFGLILWHVMINHDAAWSFGRYDRTCQAPRSGTGGVSLILDDEI